MLGRISRHLSYANVMATIAMFVAFGGASYAAVTLSKNSVGTTQLKNNAVTGAKIRNSTVTGADVKNGSLSTKDLAGTLPAGQAGAPGAKGESGAPGPSGATGATGARGPSDAYYTASAFGESSVNATGAVYDSLSLPEAGSYLVSYGLTVGTRGGGAFDIANRVNFSAMLRVGATTIDGGRGSVYGAPTGTLNTNVYDARNAGGSALITVPGPRTVDLFAQASSYQSGGVTVAISSRWIAALRVASATGAQVIP